MKLLIDDTELRYLLEQKRDYIGHFSSNGIADTFAGVTFLASLLVSNYQDVWIISGASIKTFLCLLGIIFTVRGVYMVVKKDLYNQEDLYNDIEKLNSITHNHSIVAIKDTFNPYPNRFLLYFDERWGCKFFFSFKTSENDAENIKLRLSSELQVDPSDISVTYKTHRIQTKHSVSHNEERTYDHSLYSAEISHFPEDSMQNEFEINGKKFYWMSISEMEQDKTIMKINSDVVGFVKDVIV